MGIAILVVRLFLAAVFAVAGAAKLADRRGSEDAAVGFGIPRRFAGIVAFGLPLAELAVAGVLLPAGSALWGLAGAVALLTAFTAAIGLSMARGRAPDCHCFGQIHSEPAGPRTLIRNGALLALALAALVAAFGETGPSAVAWLGDLTATQALLVAAGALVAGVVGGIFIGRALREPELQAGRPDPTEQGLPEGSDAPDFALPGLDGSTVTLSEFLRRGAPVVLVFTDADCASCQHLMPLMAEWQKEHEGAVTIAVINGGSPDGTREAALEHGLQDILFDPDREVHKAYEVLQTPAAVRVDPPAMISTPFVGRPFGVKSLVDAAVTGQDFVIGLLPGAELPQDLVLHGADGAPIRLTDFVGEETLFLFWDPGCGTCREIREQLQEWERNPLQGTPRIVLITSAARRAVRAEGFKSTILFDPDRVTAEALEAKGTPMAVLVDAEGRIAWPLATGRRHIMRLIQSRAPISV